MIYGSGGGGNFVCAFLAPWTGTEKRRMEDRQDGDDDDDDKPPCSRLHITAASV